MERECLLTVLIALLSGIAVLASGWWPAAQVVDSDARCLEGAMWRRIWLPLVPAVLIAAWLCGWALVEPDPVPLKVPTAILLASVPFIFLFGRTALRAGWSLFRSDEDPATATVGLLRPWILFSPYLAKKLDDRAIEAALEHERAHVRHRDPLRVWLGQLATDLQWPWPQAGDRLRQWMLALELARDEEARAAGVDGSHLASAILASVRFQRNVIPFSSAALIGEPSALKQRIARLLDPLPDNSEQARTSARVVSSTLVASLLLAAALGSIFGERVVQALLRISA